LERIFKETRSWNRPQKFGVNNVYAELDTAALFGEITIKNGRVEQGNFDDYRMLRINEAPLIDVHLVKSTEAPGGVGEPGTSAVMPAVANAIFAATGKRVRKLPINSAQLKSI
jgi:isoquinoline 1-oxidoreductase subunit beta